MDGPTWPTYSNPFDAQYAAISNPFPVHEMVGFRTKGNGTVQDSVEHIRGNAAGERVLLAWVIAAEQHHGPVLPAANNRLSAMAERRGGPAGRGPAPLPDRTA